MKLIEIEGKTYRECTVKYRGMWLPAFVLEENYKQEFQKKQIKKMDGRSRHSSVRDRFWRVFTDFIRTRDNYTCVTCGATPPKIIQTGHYLPKSAYSGIYFDERNNHAQCTICNMNMEDPKIKKAYDDFMLKTYGQETVEMLKILGKQKGLSTIDMEILIPVYKEKLNKLNQLK